MLRESEASSTHREGARRPSCKQGGYWVAPCAGNDGNHIAWNCWPFTESTGDCFENSQRIGWFVLVVENWGLFCAHGNISKIEGLESTSHDCNHVADWCSALGCSVISRLSGGTP